MPRTHRDQYADTNIEMHIKTFNELRPDHPNGSTRNMQVRICFWCSFLKKKVFGHKYIILAMFNLESIVNFLFFLLHHFIVVPAVATIILPTYCTVAVLSKLSSAFYSLTICVLVLDWVLQKIWCCFSWPNLRNVQNETAIHWSN